MKKTKVILVGKGYGFWESDKIPEVPDDTEIWGINDLILKKIDVDLVFNMHLLEEFTNVDMAGVDLANSIGIPTIMPKKYKQITNSIEFPLKKLMKEYGTDYFMTGIAYMFAYAIYKGMTQIDCYGINMRGDDEKYKNARACVEYWIGYARGKGIEVNMKGRYCDCLKIFDRKLYGYKDVFQTDPYDITDRSLYVTFGTGLDRMGLSKLTYLLSLQEDSLYYIDANPVPLDILQRREFLYDHLTRLVNHTWKDSKTNPDKLPKYTGDMCHQYMHIVENIYGSEHTARIICIEGDEVEVKKDWLEFSGDKILWTDPKHESWKEEDKHELHAFFPSYESVKDKAFDRYYKEYYQIAKRCRYKYPLYFKYIKSEVLDTEAGQKEILDHIGYENHVYTDYKEFYKLNKVPSNGNAPKEEVCQKKKQNPKKKSQVSDSTEKSITTNMAI